MRSRALLLVPLAFGWLACLALRPDARSLAAPLFGPWAGYVFGHGDCTMASVMPAWTAVAVTLGVVAIMAFVLPRPTAVRAASPFVVLAWASMWVGLAVMSVLNTLA